MYFVFLKETKKSKKSRRRGSREQREKDRAEVNSSEFKTFEIFNHNTFKFKIIDIFSKRNVFSHVFVNIIKWDIRKDHNISVG